MAGFLGVSNGLALSRGVRSRTSDVACLFGIFSRLARSREVRSRTSGGLTEVAAQPVPEAIALPPGQQPADRGEDEPDRAEGSKARHCRENQADRKAAAKAHHCAQPLELLAGLLGVSDRKSVV